MGNHFHSLQNYILYMPAIEFAENNLSYISINVILYLHTYQIMHASLKILSAYIVTKNAIKTGVSFRTKDSGHLTEEMHCK